MIDKHDHSTETAKAPATTRLKLPEGATDAQRAVAAEDALLAFMPALERMREGARARDRAACLPDKKAIAVLAEADDVSDAELVELEETLGAARSQRPDARITAILAGALIDAIPAGLRGDPEPYLRWLVHDLAEAEMPPVAVALAFRNLRRSAKFCPSIGEALEAAEKARSAIFAGFVSVRIEMGRRRLKPYPGAHAL